MMVVAGVCGSVFVWFVMIAGHHHHHHHHHHQITKLSHSINAIGPAPHRSGRKRAIMILIGRLLATWCRTSCGCNKFNV
jgi:hypothetical protein